jgi:signal peptidase
VWLLHLRLEPVLSGSMRPSIQPGDLAVTRPIPADEIEEGDVIAYYPPGQSEARLHRVTSVRRDDGVWVTTKGDANSVEDPWGRVKLRGTNAYRLTAVIPKIGYLPVWTRGVRGPVLIAAGLLLGLSLIGARQKSGGPRHQRAAAEGRTP